MTTAEATRKWKKLDGVHPVLVRKIVRVLLAMDTLGFPMTVVQGLRTADYQNALYQQGRTKPGKIVTNVDGIKVKSNHQAKDDGYGHAVDCAFVSADGGVDWADDLPWSTYGRCATAVGLRWGGDWVSFVDRPHVELPRSV